MKSSLLFILSALFCVSLHAQQKQTLEEIKDTFIREGTPSVFVEFTGKTSRSNFAQEKFTGMEPLSKIVMIKDGNFFWNDQVYSVDDVGRFYPVETALVKLKAKEMELQNEVDRLSKIAEGDGSYTATTTSYGYVSQTNIRKNTPSGKGTKKFYAQLNETQNNLTAIKTAIIKVSGNYKIFQEKRKKYLETASSQPAQSPPVPANDTEKKLLKLKQLLDKGLITQDVYKEKVKEILK